MNKSEAILTNTLLAWLLDVEVNTELVTPEQALDAAARLADRVTAALHAGISSDRVRKEWNEAPPAVSRGSRCGVELYEQYGAGPEIDLGPCVLDHDHGGDCLSQVELDRRVVVEEQHQALRKRSTEQISEDFRAGLAWADNALAAIDRATRTEGARS